MKRIKVLLLLFVVYTNQGNSQILSDADKTKIRELCYQENGIEKIKGILESNMNKFQVAALRNSGQLDSILTVDANDKCNKFSGKESIIKPINFDFQSLNLAYNNYWVRCGWDADVEREYTINMPSGYQVCSYSYEVKWEGYKYEVDLDPIKWYNGDPEYPPRFTGLKLTLYSRGNNDALFPKRGGVTVDVKVKAIMTKFLNGDRFDMGCQIPEKTIGSGTATTTRLDNEEPFTIESDINLGVGTWEYTSEKNNYYVYTHESDAKDDCDSSNWIFSGIISPENNMAIRVFPGEKKKVRILREKENICAEENNRLVQNLFVEVNNKEYFTIPVNLKE